MTADAMALELAGARIAELEHDLIAFREVAVMAIHALHQRTVERDRLREQLRQLRGGTSSGGSTGVPPESDRVTVAA